MAQHIKIKKKDEPGVFKSAQKLATMVKFHKHLFGLEDMEPVAYNGRTAQILPDEYCTTQGAFRAIAMKPFKLRSRKWKDEPWKDEASIECHVSEIGQVLSIFVVA